LIRFFLRKAFLMILSFMGIALFTFCLMHLVPGDPFSDVEGLPKEVHHQLKQQYQLDQPIYIQFKNYLLSYIQGDFGVSMKHVNLSVSSIIVKSFPLSFAIGSCAFLGACFFGILLGILQAQYKSFMLFLLLMGLLSIPNFLLAPFIQYIFGIKLEWLPIARASGFKNLILPIIAIAALPTAFIANFVGSRLQQVLQCDYIKTARCKGLSQWQIVFKHALKNACLPLFPYMPILAANVLTGSVVVEKVFSLPGLGYWFVASIAERDYPMIMGITLFFSSILLLLVLVFDLLYAYMDPRIE